MLPLLAVSLPAALAAVLAALLPAAPAAAQVAVESSDLSPRVTPVTGWLTYRRITFQDSAGAKTNLNQFSAPVSIKARLARNLSVVLYGAFARTEVRQPVGGGPAQILSGLTDTRARLFYHRGGTVLSAGVSLPTGKHSLTAEEEQIAAVAATDVYGFRVRRLGEGVAAEAGVTHALEAGANGALAVGVAALYRGSFKPTAGSQSKYRPGSELSASVGYDYGTPTTLVRLNVAGRMYARDQADGVPVFRQGPALVLEERWVARPAGRLTNDVALHQVIKGTSDQFGGTGGTVASGSTENGSSFGGVERLELEAGRNLRLAAVAEGSFHGRNAAGFESAHLLGVGGEIIYRPSPRAQVRLMGKFLTGAADPGNIKLSGFDVGAVVRVAM
jgi:hypothetical protein